MKDLYGHVDKKLLESLRHIKKESNISTRDLALFLMYVTGWENYSSDDKHKFDTWLGYNFSDLQHLNRYGYITNHLNGATSITTEGLKKVREIFKRHFKHTICARKINDAIEDKDLNKVVYVTGFDPDYGTHFLFYRYDGIMDTEHGFKNLEEIDEWLKEQFPGWELSNETCKDSVNL